MRISQKKTCRGCAARGCKNGGWLFFCWLNYPIINDEHGTPTVPCPKPLNNKEYLQAPEYSRPTPRAFDGGQAGENNGQVALPTANNA